MTSKLGSEFRPAVCWRGLPTQLSCNTRQLRTVPAAGEPCRDLANHGQDGFKVLTISSQHALVLE
jgi:hypothetical protein